MMKNENERRCYRKRQWSVELIAVQQPAQAQPQDGQYSGQAFAEIDLGDSVAPVIEEERHFLHAGTDFSAAKQDFFGDGVSASDGFGPVDAPQQFHAIAAEAAAVVLAGQSQQQPSPHVDQAAHEFSSAGPPQDSAARNIAGGDSDVAVFTGSDQFWYGVNGVTEVGIHIDQQFVVLADAKLEAGGHGGTESQLSGSVQDMQSGFAESQLFDQLSGAVGRIVIDDEDLQIGAQVQQQGQQFPQILDFVVGTECDEDTQVEVSAAGELA